MRADDRLRVRLPVVAALPLVLALDADATAFAVEANVRRCEFVASLAVGLRSPDGSA